MAAAAGAPPVAADCRGSGAARVGARQRGEVLREVRGQAPVVPGDAPILDRLAKTLIANSWMVLVLAALMMLILTNLLTSPPRAPLLGAVLLLAVAFTLAGAEPSLT